MSHQSTLDVEVIHTVDRSEETLLKGTVLRKSLGYCTVVEGGRTLTCAMSNRLRKRLIYPIADPASIRPHVVAVADIRQVDPIAVGDVVRFVDADDGTGLIAEVLPRRSRLSRRAAGAKPLEQVLVANVHQVIPIVAGARPALKWDLLDRYVAAAEAWDLPALVCITKVDLVDTEELTAEVETYRRIGYRVVLTSAVTGEGVESIRRELEGRVSVFMGKSGVGKTTLLNLIQPGLGLRVGEVSAYSGKGRHTTSHLELFPLDAGGAVVDTPGMREFGVWEIPARELASLVPEMRPHLFRGKVARHPHVWLASLFPELRPHLADCRFGVHCSHTHEPGCAIKLAVETGEVSERRYRSYLRMRA